MPTNEQLQSELLEARTLLRATAQALEPLARLDIPDHARPAHWTARAIQGDQHITAAHVMQAREALGAVSATMPPEPAMPLLARVRRAFASI